MITAASRFVWLGVVLASLAGAAPRGRPGRVAREPLERRLLLAVGAERALAGSGWLIDEGEANVALVAAHDGSLRVRAERPGRATLHREGEVLRVVVAAGSFSRGASEAALDRVSFSGRERSGAFVGEPVRARVRVPREAAEGLALRVVSFDGRGAFAGEVAFGGSGEPCRDDASLRCFDSGALRLVPEAIETEDASVGERGLAARLGGRIAVLAGSDELVSRPVCVDGEGACGFSVRLRPLLVRAFHGGPTVFHGVPEGDEAAFRERIERVMRPWESCGIRARVDPVRVVDPPRDWLLSFGLPFGLPSDGSEVVEVRVGKRVVTVAVPPKLSPREAARFVEERLRAAGLEVIRHERPWLTHEERPSAEVRVLPAHGDLAVHVRRAGRLAIEATRVELRDGLEHFDDARAASGSQEERALLLPLVDDERATVEVFAVPFFSDGRRVGESFVAMDDPALANVVLVDRSGLAATRTSHVLAHEIGHVLARSGDHPDEGSRDTPRLLMDSDASDASRFGPRLLTVDECARARTQGSRAPHAVLTPFAPP